MDILILHPYALELCPCRTFKVYPEGATLFKETGWAEYPGEYSCSPPVGLHAATTDMGADDGDEAIGLAGGNGSQL